MTTTETRPTTSTTPQGLTRIRWIAALVRDDIRRVGYARFAAMAVAAVLIGCLVGTGASKLVTATKDAVTHAVQRPTVAHLATDWGAAQRTVEPLPSMPGTRPVLVKDEGDLATACRLSGWSTASCADTGLIPRLDYGTPPHLVEAWPVTTTRWAVLLGYTDAADATTPRWVALNVVRTPTRAWQVDSFIDVPLSSTPSREDTEGVLRNAARCEPTSAVAC